MADIYDRAERDLIIIGSSAMALHYGPGHVVWEDENFDSAEWCLENFEKYKGDKSEDELEIVKRSLEELAAIPLDFRCVEPEDYDEEHPENFPPEDGIEMIRR